MIDRGNGRKTLKEGKPVRHVNKKPQSYEIIDM